MQARNFVFRNVSLAAALVVAAAGSLGAEEKFTEEFHQTVPLGAGGRVSLENINGRIQVTAWDRNEVQIDAVKSARSRDQLDEMKIIVRGLPDSVEIRTEHPSGSRRGERDGGAVSYTVQVPRGARLDSIESVNGRVTVEGTSGAVKVESVNGRIDWRGSSDNLTLETVNGGIEAEFDGLGAGTANLETVNGGIIVSLPGNASASMSASSVHGDIASDFQMPVRQASLGAGRRVNFTVGGGSAQVRLETVNGPIKIQRK